MQSIPPDAEAALTAWAAAHWELDQLLRDAADARETIAVQRENLAWAEAELLAAGVDGRDAAQRTARAFLAVRQDAAAMHALQRIDEARATLFRVERRIGLIAARCRLYAAVVAVHGRAVPA